MNNGKDTPRIYLHPVPAGPTAAEPAGNADFEASQSSVERLPAIAGPTRPSLPRSGMARILPRCAPLLSEEKRKRRPPPRPKASRQSPVCAMDNGSARRKTPTASPGRLPSRSLAGIPPGAPGRRGPPAPLQGLSPVHGASPPGQRRYRMSPDPPPGHGSHSSRWLPGCSSPSPQKGRQ